MGVRIMKFKRIIFVSILLLAILIIGAVSASNVKSTEDTITQEKISIDD